MSNVNKVCPNCGCESFVAHEEGIREVIINGEGKVLSQSGFVPTKQSDEIMCIGCKKEMPKGLLVSESYFHEVIATQPEAQNASKKYTTRTFALNDVDYMYNFSDKEIRYMHQSDVTAVQNDEDRWHILKDKIKIGHKAVTTEYLNEMIDNKDVKLLMLYHNGNYLKNF